MGISSVSAPQFRNQPAVYIRDNHMMMDAAATAYFRAGNPLEFLSGFSESSPQGCQEILQVLRCLLRIGPLITAVCKCQVPIASREVRVDFSSQLTNLHFFVVSLYCFFRRLFSFPAFLLYNSAVHYFARLLVSFVYLPCFARSAIPSHIHIPFTL